jgi:hypothetical protein
MLTLSGKKINRSTDSMADAVFRVSCRRSHLAVATEAEITSRFAIAGISIRDLTTDPASVEG